MVKRVQSVDGFVVRRRVKSTDQSEHIVNNSNNSNNLSSPQRRIINDPDFTGKTPANYQLGDDTGDTMNPEQQLLNDIEDSLNQIDDITPPESEDSGRHQRRARRHQMEQRAKKPRKKVSKGKIVKWIVIVIILAILGVVGYLAVKAFFSGGKVFHGTPLDIITTKTSLTEGENGRTNILIFGTSGYTMDEDAWDGAMLTDSIMVVSLDQDNNDAYMMSLPRDLYVRNNCPALGKTSGKLNEVFYCAYTTDKNEVAGAEALMANRVKFWVWIFNITFTPTGLL